MSRQEAQSDRDALRCSLWQRWLVSSHRPPPGPYPRHIRAQLQGCTIQLPLQVSVASEIQTQNCCEPFLGRGPSGDLLFPPLPPSFCLVGGHAGGAQATMLDQEVGVTGIKKQQYKWSLGSFLSQSSQTGLGLPATTP